MLEVERKFVCLPEDVPRFSELATSSSVRRLEDQYFDTTDAFLCCRDCWLRRRTTGSHGDGVWEMKINPDGGGSQDWEADRGMTRYREVSGPHAISVELDWMLQAHKVVAPRSPQSSSSSESEAPKAEEALTNLGRMELLMAQHGICPFADIVATRRTFTVPMRSGQQAGSDCYGTAPAPAGGGGGEGGGGTAEAPRTQTLTVDLDTCDGLDFSVGEVEVQLVAGDAADGAAADTADAADAAEALIDAFMEQHGLTGRGPVPVSKVEVWLGRNDPARLKVLVKAGVCRPPAESRQ